MAGALAGGFGLTLVFAVAIYGAVRAVDLRRDGRAVIAGAFAVLAVLALVGVLAGVVYGVTIITNKG